MTLIFLCGILHFIGFLILMLIQLRFQPPELLRFPGRYIFIGLDSLCISMDAFFINYRVKLNNVGIAFLSTKRFKYSYLSSFIPAFA